MLGVGDFYYELGVQIVEVCMATNHRNGGKVYNNAHNNIMLITYKNLYILLLSADWLNL